MAGLAGRIAKVGIHRGRPSRYASPHTAPTGDLWRTGFGKTVGWNKLCAVPAFSLVCDAGTALCSFQPATFESPNFQTVRLCAREVSLGKSDEFERRPAAMDSPGNPGGKAEEKDDPRLCSVRLVFLLTSRRRFEQERGHHVADVHRACFGDQTPRRNSHPAVCHAP